MKKSYTKPLLLAKEKIYTFIPAVIGAGMALGSALGAAASASAALGGLAVGAGLGAAAGGAAALANKAMSEKLYFDEWVKIQTLEKVSNV